MKIVVLNLADEAERGLVSSVVDTIRAKYTKTFLQRLANRVLGTNTVTEYNLIPMLDHQAPKLGPKEIDTTFVRDHCSRADRVIVAVHGHFDNREEGTVKMAVGSETAISLPHLVDLIGGLLVPSRHYELTLLMCYGARTASYQLHQFVGTVDWSTSFAYRFYEKLAADYDIRMVAFTGSVRVDSQSERFHIQTEMAVMSEVDFRERESQFAAAREAWQALQQHASPDDLDEFEKKLDVLTNPQSRQQPSADPRLREGYRVVSNYAFFVNQMSDMEEKQAGVGKIVFIRRKGRTVVLTHDPKLRFLYPPDLATT